MQLTNVQKIINYIIYPSSDLFAFLPLKTSNRKFIKLENFLLAFDWSNCLEHPKMFSLRNLRNYFTFSLKQKFDLFKC